MGSAGFADLGVPWEVMGWEGPEEGVDRGAVA